MNDKVIKRLTKLYLKSLKHNSFPVSALVLYNNKIISAGYNNRKKSNLTIDHAEIRAISKANKKLNEWRLSECELIVTLEPCEMCKKIINEARIKKVIYFVERKKEKKQFNKTNYKLIDDSNYYYNDKFINEYKENISYFFEDKR